MKRLFIAMLALACLHSVPALAESGLFFAAPETSNDLVYRDALYDPSTLAPAKTQDRMQMAQAAPVTTTMDTKTSTPSEPASVTTTVKGGTLAAQVLEWLQVVFGSTAGVAFLWVVIRGLKYIGIQITDAQKAQLQAIIVNGLNAAAVKAEVSLKNNRDLDVPIKNQIVADAVTYTQEHAAETIKALGLDPKDPKAVEGIKARIETALNDPATPTPAAITPENGKPMSVNGVLIQGTKA